MNLLTSEQSESLKITKFLFILGVVLIHCNIQNNIDIEQANQTGLWIINLISDHIVTISVPCFFILSGFLYFLNIEKFSQTVYIQKSKKRCKSLVIPYLLWNLIGCILQLIGYKYLNYPSYGIIDGNHINWIKLFEGFWVLRDSYPYATAFWFIRNLIIFVSVTPAVYFIGAKKPLLVLFILICLIFNTSMYGFEYFVIGAYLGINRHSFSGFINSLLSTSCGLIWLISGFISKSSLVPDELSTLLSNIEVCSAFIFLIGVSSKLTKYRQSKIFSSLVGSTFFIYAVHQFLVTFIKKLLLNTLGYGNFWNEMSVYILSFVMLVFISFFCWLVMKQISPKLVRILSGGR